MIKSKDTRVTQMNSDIVTYEANLDLICLEREREGVQTRNFLLDESIKIHQLSFLNQRTRLNEMNRRQCKLFVSPE